MRRRHVLSRLLDATLPDRGPRALVITEAGDGLTKKQLSLRALWVLRCLPCRIESVHESRERLPR